MNRIFLIFFVLVMGLTSVFAQTEAKKTNPLIPLNTEWKQSIFQFSQDSIVHPAWGHEHFERMYLMCLKIAKMDSIEIDEEVLFAACFLHDMGAHSPFSIEGEGHAEASAIQAPDRLKNWGFPMEKIEAVKTTILSHHKKVNELPDLPEAWLLRDADFLDFRGVIGIARLTALTENDKFLDGAKVSIEKCIKAAPEGCKTKTANAMLVERTKQMKQFLTILEEQSFGFEAL